MLASRSTGGRHCTRTSTMLTQCSGLHSIRKMCHFASIVSQDGEIRFCTAACDPLSTRHLAMTRKFYRAEAATPNPTCSCLT